MLLCCNVQHCCCVFVVFTETIVCWHNRGCWCLIRCPGDCRGAVVISGDDAMLAFCRVILLWRVCDSMSWRQHVVLSSYLRRCCNVSSRGVYCVLFLAGLVWSVPPGGRGHSMHIANNRGIILSNKLSHIIAHLFSHFHNLADPTLLAVGLDQAVVKHLRAPPQMRVAWYTSALHCAHGGLEPRGLRYIKAAFAVLAVM